MITPWQAAHISFYAGVNSVSVHVASDGIDVGLDRAHQKPVFEHTGQLQNAVALLQALIEARRAFCALRAVEDALDSLHRRLGDVIEITQACICRSSQWSPRMRWGRARPSFFGE